jgi:hypothetical protein
LGGINDRPETSRKAKEPGSRSIRGRQCGDGLLISLHTNNFFHGRSDTAADQF